MTKMHQPLVTRYRHHDPSVFYSCTCGVSCGTTLADWRSHVLDQQILNPDTTVFNSKVLTPELYVLSKAWSRAAENVNHSMRIVKNHMQRSFRAVAEAFGPLRTTADLMEQGRRLASQREAELEIPSAPRCFHRRLMVVSEGPDKYTECLDCKTKFAGKFTPHE